MRVTNVSCGVTKTTQRIITAREDVPKKGTIVLISYRRVTMFGVSYFLSTDGNYNILLAINVQLYLDKRIQEV